jgi:hypothetical protein
MKLQVAAFVSASVLLAGCAPMLVGPSIAVMPGANKPFEAFVQDDQLCRGWAAHSIGQPGYDAAAQQLVGSTLAGTVFGALIGAALGGDHHAAAAGAVMGGMFGGAVGANQGAAVAWDAQRLYDIAYQQCMHSKGNYAAPVTVPPPPVYRYSYPYSYPYPPAVPVPIYPYR